MSEIITFAQAIHQATEDAMNMFDTVHVLGLGATYPNGLDGTMGSLAKQFPDRVHDTPCSENAVTGMAVGMAISGLRPIVHHGRVEFALHAMDQIITQAAKWDYMFGGGYPCPLTLRIATGRQWGNGPQHTLTAKGLFAVPGLRVVSPATPETARGLLLSAVIEPNPVVFLESRWLYKLRGTADAKTVSLDKCRVMHYGGDITIVAVGDMVLEALKAAHILEECSIFAEIIDLVSVYPLDTQTIQESAAKTGYLLVVDASTPGYSTARDIAGALDLYEIKTAALTCPDTACPTAPALASGYYPTRFSIVSEVFKMLHLPCPDFPGLSFVELHLPPSDNVIQFSGNLTK